VSGLREADYGGRHQADYGGRHRSPSTRLPPIGRATPGAVTPLRRDRADYGGRRITEAGTVLHRRVFRPSAARPRGPWRRCDETGAGASSGRITEAGTVLHRRVFRPSAARARGPWRRCDETGAGASSGGSWSTCAAAHGGTAKGGWWGAWVARGVPWSAGSGLPLGNGGGGGRASPGAVAPLRRDRRWCEFWWFVVDLRSAAHGGTAQGGWWGAWVARGVPWSAGSGLPLGNGGGGGRASPGAVTPLRRDRCWCEFGGLVVDLRSGARRERHRAAGGGRGSLGACLGRPGLDCRSGTAAAVAARARGP
jgi:hypothetical protein